MTTDGTQNIARDVEALRETYGTDVKAVNGLQWLMFALILIFVIIAAFWTLRPDPLNRPILIYNAGVDLSGQDDDNAWMSEATEQSLNSYLDIGDDLQIVNMARNPGGFAPSSDKADWIMSAALTQEVGETLSLNLKLESQSLFGRNFDTELTGVSTGLGDLSARASAQIYTWLDQQPLTADARSNARAELPQHPEAQKAYAKGYEALLEYDSQAALGHFEKALKIGGDHPVVYNRMARALNHLGRRADYKKAQTKAYESRENLSRERQLELEAHYLSVINKKKRAREVFEALKEFDSYNLSYRYHIISIFNLGAKPDQAMAEIEAIKALPKPFSDDPGLGLYEARTWYQFGNYEKGRNAALQVAEVARELGDKGLLAEALLNSGNADRAKYLEQLFEARDLYEEIGNPDKLAAVLTSIGNHYQETGKLAKSESFFRDAIQMSRSIGNEPRVVFTQNSLAIVLDLQGKLEEGLALKQQVKDYYKVRNNKVRHSIMLENINISLFKLGRLEEAEIILDEGLAVFTSIKDSIGIAWAPMYRARIRLRQGNLVEAESLAQQALKNSETNPEGGLEVEAKYVLAEIKFHRGNFSEAANEFSKAEKIFTEADGKLDVALAQHMQARLRLRLKDYHGAKKVLEKAISTFTNSGSPDYILDAHTTHVDLVFERSEDKIETACNKLDSLILGQQYQTIVLRAQTRQARCMLANGSSFEAASNKLIDVEGRAKALGLFEAQLESKIIRIKILEQLGETDPAALERSNLEALASSKDWDVSWAFQ